MKKTYLVLWIMLILTVVVISFTSKNEVKDKTDNSTQQLEISETATPSPEPQITATQMKGMWVAYMDLVTKEGTEQSFKENFEKILNQAKEIGINSLFVHVRPFSDALYDSSYYPWSHIITGTQGKVPNFDPLAYMLDLCHQNNMEFHAWINPLRVSLSKTPESFSSDNPYTQWSEKYPYYFIQTESGIILNPAYEEVRNLITNGVKEIVKKYDVDGIHFDDYFYPSNINDQDKVSYDNYKSQTEVPLEIEQWRKSNINSLISQVYREIKNINKNVSFGISPQANLNNNEELFADVLTWCSVRGYIDYICPQIYFSYENPSLAFDDSLEIWVNIPKYDGLKMYVGLGLYKAGTDSDQGTWENSDNIIASQILDCFDAKTNGVIIYDSTCFEKEEAQKEIENIKKVLESK